MMVFGLTLISIDEIGKADAFIRRHQEEKYLNFAENRTPEKEKIFGFGLVGVFIILGCLLYIVYSLIFG